MEPTKRSERPVRLSLRARGPWAWFPAAEPAPWSLPWPEPAAARALFESVLWKPRLRWVVREIALLRPIRYARVACPEDAPPLGLRAGEPLYALAEVDYRIGADLYLNPEVAPRDAADNHGKYAAMFTRRLGQGRGHHGAFFGLRGFDAALSPATGEERPVAIDVDFGPMRADWAGGVFEAAARGGVVRVSG